MTAPCRLEAAGLRRFCLEVYTRVGLASEDAELSTEVLLAADRRGIPTHGVRLLPRHVAYLRGGVIDPAARLEVLAETPTTLTLDAGHAIGTAVGVRTMRWLLRKAASAGTAFASVRRSTHFGIAGYHAGLALEQGMIGIAMTNANPVGLPTFGAEGRFGTNPLAVAVPAGREPPFILDMATTTITNGTVERAAELGLPLPPGEVVDRHGQAVIDARQANPGLAAGDCFLLPLGGAGEDHGGHKGYGLAVLVDLLSAALAGGPLGPEVPARSGSYPGSSLSHFFGVIDPAAFRDLTAFRADVDRVLCRLRETLPEPGQERVYYPGLKEAEQLAAASRLGVPVDAEVVASLRLLAVELGLEPPAVQPGAPTG